MNASLTFNSVVFEKAISPVLGTSLRQSTARGINTPDVLSIKNQPYTDSFTKVDGRRFNERIDLWDVDSTTGKRNKLSAYIVIEVPEIATGANVTVLLATFRALVATAGHLEDVLNSEE